MEGQGEEGLQKGEDRLGSQRVEAESQVNPNTERARAQAKTGIAHKKAVVPDADSWTLPCAAREDTQAGGWAGELGVALWGWGSARPRSVLGQTGFSQSLSTPGILFPVGKQAPERRRESSTPQRHQIPQLFTHLQAFITDTWANVPAKRNEGQDFPLSENGKLHIIYLYIFNLKAIHVSFHFYENSSTCTLKAPPSSTQKVLEKGS